jgi:hypothetical protein
LVADVILSVYLCVRACGLVWVFVRVCVMIGPTVTRVCARVRERTGSVFACVRESTRVYGRFVRGKLPLRCVKAQALRASRPVCYAAPESAHARARLGMLVVCARVPAQLLIFRLLMFRFLFI